MTKIKCNKIILLNSIFDGFIYIEDGKIIEVTKEDKPCKDSIDFTGYYVSPGFVEMHTHGGGGFAFADSSVGDIVKCCNFHLKHGTTTIVPTVTSGPFENMKASAINIINAIKNNESKANIAGVHLEGPYLSKKQSGAQCLDYITPPCKEDYLPFLKNYGAYIKKWTYAPEEDTDFEFTKTLSKFNIIPSIGHSDAKYDDIKKAMLFGANMITHLYSCTSTITRDHGFRILGINECAYLFDDISVEIIADGKHLPPELLKYIFKFKDIDKIVLISDSLQFAGTNIKEGSMSGTDFIIEDGVAKLKDRSAFAGSIATSDILVKNILNLGLSINDVIKMASTNPSRLLGLNKGEIKSGMDADLIVFDENINIKHAIVAGKEVF